MPEGDFIDLFEQLFNLRAGTCGCIDVNCLLTAPYESAYLRVFRHRHGNPAVTVQGGRAAFLRLGLHVFHFSFLLRLRFAVDVVKWIHRRLLILQLFDTSSLT